jgi:flavin-dependent dehydrogenase
VLAGSGYQPPDAPLSRGLEVHPGAGASDDALDVWVDRSLAPRGFAWRVPAGEEERIGVGSYEPRHHVREPTEDLAQRLGADVERWQGNWFPHRLRAAAEDGVFFCGDSAGHCFPLSGEGIRTAFHFGIAAGREIRAVHAGEQTREQALERYASFSAGHAHAFRRALRLQRLVPALPPRLLTLALRALKPQPIVDRMFGWYLAQAPPPRG